MRLSTETCNNSPPPFLTRLSTLSFVMKFLNIHTQDLSGVKAKCFQRLLELILLDKTGNKEGSGKSILKKNDSYIIT